MTSIQYVTAFEAGVIAQTKGRRMVSLPVLLADGSTVDVQFCGLCGRSVCHPSCVSGSWSSPDSEE